MGTNLERHDSTDKEQALLKRDEDNSEDELDDLIKRKKECQKEEDNGNDDDGGDIIHDSSFHSSALMSNDGEQRISTKKLVLSRVEVPSSSPVPCALEENPSDEDDDDDDGEDNDTEENEEETALTPPPLGLYLSPIHHHSFQSLDNNILPNLPLLWRRYKKCCICKSYFTDKKGLVKCVSCGCLAHRTCSFDVPEEFRHTMQTCAANEKLIEQQQQQKEEDCNKEAEEEEMVFIVEENTSTSITQQQNNSAEEEATTKKDAGPAPQPLPQPKSIFGKICVSWRSDSPSNIHPTPVAAATTELPNEQPIAPDNDEYSSASFEIHPTLPSDDNIGDETGDNKTDQVASDPKPSDSTNNNDNIGDRGGEESEVEGDIVTSTRSFASVATTLQENVLLLFDNRNQQAKQQNQHENDNNENGDIEESKQQQEEVGENKEISKDSAATPSLSKQSSFSISGLAAAIGIKKDTDEHKNDHQQQQQEETDDSNKDEDDVKGILKEVDPQPPPTPPPTPPSLLQTTYQLSQISRTTKSRMGMASVAGGIAGGVAGLIISGPVGAIALSKICQTAGVVSVLLDGTVSVGVLVASATAAKIAVDQVQKNNQDMQGGKRMIALKGASQETNNHPSKTVMLVRPNVIIDPIWAQYTEEAKLQRSNKPLQNQNKRSFNLGQSIILNHQAKVADEAKRKRNAVDADIVYSNEDEIPTEEKVLLIVSRSLNDRLSLPGHVHNWLIQECKKRASTAAASENAKSNQSMKKGNDEEMEKRTLGGNAYTLVESDDSINNNDQDQEHSRERRQDAHGVIKHVTATLLEVRPGLGATPRLTELTATAVEALVFGELYDLVFGEIEEEMMEKDAALMKKISEFEMDHYMKRRQQQQQRPTQNGQKDEEEEEEEVGSYPITRENISVGALEALLNIPEARTPVDKLAYCVQFLETISAHFSDDMNQDEGSTGNQSDVQTEEEGNEEGIEKEKETCIQAKKKKKKRSGAEVMGADSLLKMVCEHIIVAKVPRLNAELVFLEEFARDEQLLRGKEGYSLVTLQASLHFLNASSDFDEDIFKNED